MITVDLGVSTITITCDQPSCARKIKQKAMNHDDAFRQIMRRDFGDERSGPLWFTHSGRHYCPDHKGVTS